MVAVDSSWWRVVPRRCGALPKWVIEEGGDKSVGMLDDAVLLLLPQFEGHHAAATVQHRVVGVP